jgi:hypothetical protein
MIIAISQPTFLPWLGYFNLIAAADVFVVLDTVQFEKQSWQSRNRVRTTQGEIQWLSVPVSSQPLNSPIRDIRIAQNPLGWRRKQVKTIQQHLCRAPFLKEAEALYQTILGDTASHCMLAEMNIDFIQAVTHALGLDTRLIRCSELPVGGTRAGLLLDVCRHFGADTYLSNAGSAVYLEASRDEFAAAGVKIVYQQWPHPEYKQTGAGFVSHLSCIDAVACLGVDAASAAVKKNLCSPC